MGFSYIPRSGKIYVVSLTTSWAQVLTAAQSKAIRGFLVKTRQVFDANGVPTHAPRPFDIALNSSPSAGADSDGNGFMSFGGGGTGQTFGPSNGVWAKSSYSGALLEILVFE